MGIKTAQGRVFLFLFALLFVTTSCNKLDDIVKDLAGFDRDDEGESGGDTIPFVHTLNMNNLDGQLDEANLIATNSDDGSNAYEIRTLYAAHNFLNIYFLGEIDGSSSGYGIRISTNNAWSAVLDGSSGFALVNGDPSCTNDGVFFPLEFYTQVDRWAVKIPYSDPLIGCTSGDDFVDVPEATIFSTDCGTGGDNGDCDNILDNSRFVLGGRDGALLDLEVEGTFNLDELTSDNFPGYFLIQDAAELGGVAQDIDQVGIVGDDNGSVYVAIETHGAISVAVNTYDIAFTQQGEEEKNIRIEDNGGGSFEATFSGSGSLDCAVIQSTGDASSDSQLHVGTDALQVRFNADCLGMDDDDEFESIRVVSQASSETVDTAGIAWVRLNF